MPMVHIGKNQKQRLGLKLVSRLALQALDKGLTVLGEVTRNVVRLLVANLNGLEVVRPCAIYSWAQEHAKKVPRNTDLPLFQYLSLTKRHFLDDVGTIVK
jgi:hypothetical protein